MKKINLKKKKYVYITISVKPDFLKEFDKIIKEKYLTRSFVIRNLIEKYVWEYKQKKDKFF